MKERLATGLGEGVRHMIGQRVARLRAAHGDSLREAAMRTGVSHTTIARIEKGEVTGSFHSTLKKIAEGYGVRVEYLLTGRDPRADFESVIRRLPPGERFRLYCASTKERIKVVLDFLAAEYSQEFDLAQLGQALGLDAGPFQALLDNWNGTDLAPEDYARMAEALSRLTGISPHWFRSGSLPDEAPPGVAPDRFEAYLQLARKAAQAGIPPEMLEMAIDLLIMKQEAGKAAAARVDH